MERIFRRSQRTRAHLRTLGVVGIVAALMTLGVASPLRAASSTRLVHPSLVATTSRLIPLGVSCTSQFFCLALARPSTENGGSVYSTIWNGSTLSKPQKIRGAAFEAMDDSGGLSAVSCAPANFCMAVGQSSAARTSFRWTHGGWKEIPIPAPSPVHPAPALSSISNESDGWMSISCLSSSFCMAAGGDNDQVVRGTSESEKSATTFIEWNGTTWGHAQTLQGIDIDNVSCSTSKLCVAVGGSSAVWNGAHWRLVSVPGRTSNPDTTASYTSISCVVGATCLAVGSSASTSAVIKWAGNAWHVLAAPTYSATKDLYLYQIDCHTPSLCLTYDDIPGNQHQRVVVSEWNGSRWSSAAVTGELLDGGGVEWTSANSDVVVDVSLNAATTQWLKG
jgi:hypothetical protein